VYLFVGTINMALGQKKNGFDLSNSEIQPSEVKQGGPPKDGIPALTNPKFLKKEDANYLADKDRVIGVSVNGEHRAYPIRLLNYHEIVNDKVGNEAIVISYCPLCGSALVFSAQFGQKVLEFGVSGLLYNSDVLMYDRQTNSLWSQLMMHSISGEMKGTGLEFIESEHTTWIDWKNRYPNTLVLSRETGYSRNYDRNPYEGYSESPTLFFPVNKTSDKLAAKELVLGVSLDNIFIAYPYKELKKSKTVKAKIGTTEILIEYDPESQSAIVKSANKDIVYLTSFWFAWYAFHPETEVYTP
jgi:Protein of unknown function (DUF3179)